MKRSWRTIGGLIALTVLALGGLLTLQYRFLMRSLDLRDQTFRRNVYAALNAATERIEEADVRNRFFFVKADSVPYAMKFVKRDDTQVSGRRDSAMIFTVSNFGSTSIQGDRLSYQLRRPQRVSIKIFDTFGRLDTVILDGMRKTGEHEIFLPKDRLSRGVFFLKVQTDSALSTYRWDGAKGVISSESSFGRQEREDKIIRRVTETVRDGNTLPLAKRIGQESIDSLLAQAFALNGISIEYGFEVRDMIGDSIIAQRALTNNNSDEAEFTIPVFAHDFAGTPGELTVHFPAYRTYLVSEFLPELALNLLFIGIVLAVFWYTIRTILKQKEFAEGVTDFINNMTHEFKTPLSTISLASEALNKPEVVRVRKKIDRYNRIIAEENTRMRTQVEKILHMAALEEGEYLFRRDSVDLHGIIRKAVTAVTLQVSNRKGRIMTSLNAAVSAVEGDAVHIENVIRNVLDNAEKYSPESPDLNIATENAGGQLIVRISDRGIGMTKEQAARAFDKYYRVPTGNVHDVKGFGIGLSYVKLVVEGHGGTVAIHSEPGQGTTVEISLPAKAS